MSVLSAVRATHKYARRWNVFLMRSLLHPIYDDDDDDDDRLTLRPTWFLFCFTLWSAYLLNLLNLLNLFVSYFEPGQFPRHVRSNDCSATDSFSREILIAVFFILFNLRARVHVGFIFIGRLSCHSNVEVDRKIFFSKQGLLWRTSVLRVISVENNNLFAMKMFTVYLQFSSSCPTFATEATIFEDLCRACPSMYRNRLFFITSHCRFGRKLVWNRPRRRSPDRDRI